MCQFAFKIWFVHILCSVDILQRVSIMYLTVRPTNLRKNGSLLTSWPYPWCAIDANEANIEARSLQVPGCEPEG